MPLDVVFLGERGVCAAKIGGNRLVGRESVEFAKLRLPLPSRLLGAFVRLLLRGPYSSPAKTTACDARVIFSTLFTSWSRERGALGYRA